MPSRSSRGCSEPSITLKRKQPHLLHPLSPPRTGLESSSTVRYLDHAMGDQDLVCRLEAAWELESSSGHFPFIREKAAPGNACKLSAGKGTCWGSCRTLPARPSQGGRVMRQLSELVGPSAYGAVVLGCFVLKNYQRTHPSGPPRCCRRGGTPSRWFSNKTASPAEGKRTCPKQRVAGAQPPRHERRALAGASSLGCAGIRLQLAPAFLPL